MRFTPENERRCVRRLSKMHTRRPCSNHDLLSDPLCKVTTPGVTRTILRVKEVSRYSVPGPARPLDSFLGIGQRWGRVFRVANAERWTPSHCWRDGSDKVKCSLISVQHPLSSLLASDESWNASLQLWRITVWSTEVSRWCYSLFSFFVLFLSYLHKLGVILYETYYEHHVFFKGGFLHCWNPH